MSYEDLRLSETDLGESAEGRFPSAKALLLSAEDRGQHEEHSFLVAEFLGRPKKVLGKGEKAVGGIEKDRGRLDENLFMFAK